MTVIAAETRLINLTQVSFHKAIQFDFEWKKTLILAPCDEQLQQIVTMIYSSI